jgi:hypothetical protein
MADAEVCPRCGTALRRTDRLDFPAVASYVGVELVFWAAVGLVLAFLGAPAGDGEAYAALAVLMIVAWLLLRPRQRAAREAFRARYLCEACKWQSA